MTQTLVIEFNLLVLLLQLLLESLDIRLKGLLALLMLAFQGQDLVVGLGGLPGVVKAFLVGATSILSETFDGALHHLDAFFGEHDIEPHAIDAFAQMFILALDIVQEDFFVLKLVL